MSWERNRFLMRNTTPKTPPSANTLWWRRRPSSALQWFSPSLFYSSSEWAERGGQTCPESNRILGRRNIRKGRGGREAVIEIIDGVDWMEWYDFNFNLEFSSLLTCILIWWNMCDGCYWEQLYEYVAPSNEDSLPFRPRANRVSPMNNEWLSKAIFSAPVSLWLQGETLF